MKILKLWIIFVYFTILASADPDCLFFNSIKCWPREIQDGISMISSKDTERYNCSEKSQSQWIETGEVKIGWGIYYILAGIFFQLIGWPVLFIFFHFKMDQHLKVYRLLSFIGLVGITEVWGNSIWPGVSLLTGSVYCTSRFVTTFFGKITMVQWLLGSTSAVYLGLHRLSDLFDVKDYLMKTNIRMICWLSLFTAYSVYGSLFYDTVLYNSRYMAPLLNPMIDPESTEYSNNFLRYHNIAVSIALIFVYGLIACIWRRRESVVSSISVTKFQKNILWQCIIVSLTYAVPAISFALMYFIPNPPEWFLLFADLSYQLSGGLPFLMYICLNKHLRTDLLQFLKNLRHCQLSIKNIAKVVHIKAVSTALTS